MDFLLLLRRHSPHCVVHFARVAVAFLAGLDWSWYRSDGGQRFLRIGIVARSMSWNTARSVFTPPVVAVARAEVDFLHGKSLHAKSFVQTRTPRG